MYCQIGKRGCVTVFSFATLFSCGCMVQPTIEGLDRTGVVVGDGLIMKRTLFTLPCAGEPDCTIYDAAFGGRMRLAVLPYTPITEEPLYILDLDQDSVSNQPVPACNCAITGLTDIEGDGVFELLGIYADETRVINADGTIRSSIGGNTAAGDVNGNGKLDFCVALGKSVGCVDAEGNELWEVIGQSYDSVAVAGARSGFPGRVFAERFHSFKAPFSLQWTYVDIIDVFDGDGNLLHQFQIPDGSDFEIVDWPPGDRSVIVHEGDQFVFFDFDGMQRFSYPIPTEIVNVDSYPLGFATVSIGGRFYLAASMGTQFLVYPVGLRAPLHSALLLYKTNGGLAYYELMDEPVRFRTYVDPNSGERNVVMFGNTSVYRLEEGAGTAAPQ